MSKPNGYPQHIFLLKLGKLSLLALFIHSSLASDRNTKLNYHFILLNKDITLFLITGERQESGGNETSYVYWRENKLH